MRTDPARPSPLFWALVVAGPVIWSVHFLAVYLLAEAACAADGWQQDVLGLPLLTQVVLLATVLAAVVTLVGTAAAYRQWRRSTDDPDWVDGTDRNPGLALTGFLLGLLFVVALLFVGLPVAFLEPCLA